MRNYLIICVLTILFFSLLENMLIKGSLNKIVKSVFSIICVLIIAYPITNLINGGFNLTSVNFDNEFSSHLLKIEENTTQIEVKNLLVKNNYNVKNVEVIAENENGVVSIKKINVIIKSEVINENGEHIIIINQAKELLEKNCYNCQLEVIIEE